MVIIFQDLIKINMVMFTKNKVSNETWQLRVNLTVVFEIYK